MMTQQEWHACTCPDRLLDAAASDHRLSSRKLVLLACAAARRVGHLLPEGRGPQILEELEKHADGPPFLPPPRLAHEVSALASAILASPAGQARHARHSVPLAQALPVAVQNVLIEARALRSLGCLGARPAKAVLLKARREQRLLVRDLCGDPYRPASALPSWLTWDHRLVPRFAQAIYEDREFRRLPILADALEEAGCVDQAILAHCRGPGPHARGCWVLDLVRAGPQPTDPTGNWSSAPAGASSR